MSNEKFTPREEFKSSERYFCKWEHGAKEYFSSMDGATEYANSRYERTSHMSDENFNYWLKQTYILGKEIIITQELQTITSTTAAMSKPLPTN